MTRATLSFNRNPIPLSSLQKLLTSWDTSSLLLRFFFFSSPFLFILSINENTPSCSYEKILSLPQAPPIQSCVHISLFSHQPSNFHCMEVIFNKLLYTSKLCTQFLHKKQLYIFIFIKLLMYM